MRVRGGFSLFPTGQDQGVSGLDEFGNEMGTSLPPMTQTFTGDAAQNYAVAKIMGIPSWALLVGGFAIAAILLPTGRR